MSVHQKGSVRLVQDFRDLKVWHKAHALVLSIYRLTRGFPSDERFGITSQLRRAASSIPANIAEGCGRDGNKELNRFLQIGMGSASEVEYFLLLAHDLQFVDSSTHQEAHGRLIEVKRMLASLIRSLRNRDS